MITSCLPSVFSELNAKCDGLHDDIISARAMKQGNVVVIGRATNNDGKSIVMLCSMGLCVNSSKTTV